MAKVEIALPEKFIFKTEIKIRISDINYGGHVGNDAILSLIHEARVQFLKSLAKSELDIGNNTSLIMTDALISYRAECFYGDIVEVKLGCSDVTSRSFAIIFQLLSKTSQREIAVAKTGMLGFDYSERQVKQLPKEFVAQLNQA